MRHIVVGVAMFVIGTMSASGAPPEETSFLSITENVYSPAEESLKVVLKNDGDEPVTAFVLELVLGHISGNALNQFHQRDLSLGEPIHSGSSLEMDIRLPGLAWGDYPSRMLSVSLEIHEDNSIVGSEEIAEQIFTTRTERFEEVDKALKRFEGEADKIAFRGRAAQFLEDEYQANFVSPNPTIYEGTFDDAAMKADAKRSARAAVSELAETVKTAIERGMDPDLITRAYRDELSRQRGLLENHLRQSDFERLEAQQ